MGGVALTRQHARALAEVRAWLGQQGADPLTLGVVADVEERVAAHAKAGALLRVRIKNRGDRPARARNRDWTTAELEALARLWRDGLAVAEIAERMGRTDGAVDGQVARCGLYGSIRERLPARTVRYNTGGPLTRAKRAYAARKRTEAGRDRPAIAEGSTA